MAESEIAFFFYCFILSSLACPLRMRSAPLPDQTVSESATLDVGCALPLLIATASPCATLHRPVTFNRWCVYVLRPVTQHQQQHHVDARCSARRAHDWLCPQRRVRARIFGLLSPYPPTSVRRQTVGTTYTTDAEIRRAQFEISIMVPCNEGARRRSRLSPSPSPSPSAARHAHFGRARTRRAAAAGLAAGLAAAPAAALYYV